MADDLTLGVVKIPVVMDLTGFRRQATSELRSEAGAIQREMARTLAGGGGAAVSAAGAQMGRQLGQAVAGGAEKSGREMGRDIVRGLESEFKAEKGRIAIAVAGGLLTPAAAEAEGRAAGRKYAEGMLAEIERRRAAGTMTRRDEAAFGERLSAVQPMLPSGGSGGGGPSPEEQGRRYGQGVVRGLEKELKVEEARIAVAVAKGLSPADAEARGRAAGKKYTDGMLAEMERRRAAGILTQRDEVEFGSRLRNMTNQNAQAAGVMSKAWGALGPTMVAAFSFDRMRAFAQEAFVASDALEASQRKLAGTARQAGLDFEFLASTSQDANEKFGLGVSMANDFTTEVAKLTNEAGKIELTGEALSRLLDVGAGRGLKAADTLQAIQQAILGSDEGTDKLFGRNPSALYEDYAEKIGVAAGKMDDQAKAMAILDAVMTAGERSRGAYLEYLDSDAGKAEQAAVKKQELTATFGKALQPMREFAGLISSVVVVALGGLLVMLQELVLLASAPIRLVVDWVVGGKPPTVENQGRGPNGGTMYGGLEYFDSNTPRTTDALSPEDRDFFNNLGERNRQAEQDAANAAERDRLAAIEAEKERKKEEEREAKRREAEAKQRAAAAQRQREAAQRELAERSADLVHVRQFNGLGGQAYPSLQAVPNTRVRGAIGEVVSLEREIRELVRKISLAGGASPEVMAELEALRAARDDAKAAVQRLLSDPENLVPEAVTQAQEQLADLSASFRRLGEMGITSLVGVPQQFTEAAAAVQGMDEQIRAMEDAIKAVHEAGGAATPEALAYLGVLEAQRAEYAAQADALVPLKEILDEIPGISAALFEGMQPGEIAAVQRVMQMLADSTRNVAAAERDVALARLRFGDGSREHVAAQKALAEAQAGAARSTDDLADALETAGLSGDELDRVLAIVNGRLDQVGAKSKRTTTEMERLGKTAADIQRVTSAVLGLAGALGITEGRAVKAFSALQETAQGVQQFATAYAAKDPVGMVVGGIQTVSGMINLGQSLFGETDEERQFRDAQADRFRALIQALDALRESLLRDVSTNQAEADISLIERAIRAASQHEYIDQTGNDVRQREVLREVAVQMGVADADDDKLLAIDKLAQWAAEIDQRYGTDLMSFINASDAQGFLRALQEMPDAVQEAVARMGQVGNSFAEIWDEINLRVEVGLLDAKDRIAAFLEELTKRGTDLGDLADEIAELGALDLGTEAGRSRQQELIRSIMDQLRAGGADLGDLTVDDVEALLRMFAGQEEGGGSGVVGGGAEEQVNRVNVAGTEVQVQELLWYMSAVAYNTGFIPLIFQGLSGLSMGQVPTMTAPALSQLPGTSGGGNTFYFQVDVGGVHLTTPADWPDLPSAAQAAGAQVGASIFAGWSEKYAAAGLPAPQVLTRQVRD